MGHSRRCNHRSACSAFYEHPIIASKESQRNPGNLALFGIKNARQTTCQYEFILRRGVSKSLALGLTVGFLNYHIALRHHVIDLTWP